MKIVNKDGLDAVELCTISKNQPFWLNGNLWLFAYENEVTDFIDNDNFDSDEDVFIINLNTHMLAVVSMYTEVVPVEAELHLIK